MSKRKKKTIAKLVDEASVLLQKIVRLKAADDNGYCVCFTCGVVKHWKDMDGGHFISRTWLATKLLEENLAVQCKKCNGYLRGNMIQFTLNIIELRGRKFVDELEILKHQSRKYYRDEIMDIISEYKVRLRELEK